MWMRQFLSMSTPSPRPTPTPRLHICRFNHVLLIYVIQEAYVVVVVVVVVVIVVVVVVVVVVAVVVVVVSLFPAEMHNYKWYTYTLQQIVVYTVGGCQGSQNLFELATENVKPRRLRRTT